MNINIFVLFSRLCCLRVVCINMNSRLKKPFALTLAKPLPLPRVRRAPRVALDKLRRTKLRST